LHGASLDAAVVEVFFEALRPAQLDALEAVLAEQSAEQARLDRHWQDQLRRAEYEVRLARRQYDAVDPDHRLVASELERRWEEKLQLLRQVQEQYGRYQQRPPTAGLTPEQRQQFRHVSETLPGLWGGLSVRQQKELLRCLISRVILKRVAPDQVEARVVWVSGHYTAVMTRPPIHREVEVSGYQQMVERVEQLWRGGWDNDAAIAAQLSLEGFHSARSQGVTARAVQKLRLRQGWHTTQHRSKSSECVEGWLTARGLAAKLGVERTWVYKRLYAEVIEARYVHRRPHSQVWLIKDDPKLLADLKQSLPARVKP
jgi:hypothetical protein